MDDHKLLKLVPPPAMPLFPGSASQWLDAESRLGTSLPEDYKWYVQHYGSGRMDDFLQVFNPFTPNLFCQLSLSPESAAGFRLDALREWRRGEFADLFPFPAYPEPCGLLPWGETDGSIWLYWMTKGSPNEWKVVVEYPSPYVFFVFDETLTSFLEGVISRRITCKGFDYFPVSSPVIFEPSKMP